MKTLELDLEFNEVTGTSRILIHFNDDSMSNFELNQAVKDGTVMNEILEKTAEIFGKKIAEDVRTGKIKSVCLDEHPELRTDEEGIEIQVSESINIKQELKQ